VYTSFQLAKKYLSYYLHAANGKGHGMHSPFVFDFILNVLNNKKGYVAPASLEQKRGELLKDGTVVAVQDFGAGSRNKSGQEKTIAQIAASALKPKKYAQLLFRLVKHYQPHQVLELGTSLGLTTAYLSSANPAASITTIEGSEAIAAKAADNLKHLGCKNVSLRVGNFDDVLPEVLTQHSAIDLAYIDGNHRHEPTLRYFQQLLPKMHEYSILVFDDIHWSAEMEQAWEAIKQNPAVQYSIDVFFLGFVFFRKDFKVKQHFCIRF
jgi:predicted O-methyltransferase YrrM